MEDGVDAMFQRTTYTCPSERGAQVSVGQKRAQTTDGTEHHSRVTKQVTVRGRTGRVRQGWRSRSRVGTIWYKRARRQGWLQH